MWVRFCLGIGLGCGFGSVACPNQPNVRICAGLRNCPAPHSLASPTVALTRSRGLGGSPGAGQPLRLAKPIARSTPLCAIPVCAAYSPPRVAVKTYPSYKCPSGEFQIQANRQRWFGPATD